MELTIQYSPTAPGLTSSSTELGTPTQDERTDPATMQSLPPLPMVPPLIPTSTTGSVITCPPMELLATVTSATKMMNPCRTKWLQCLRSLLGLCPTLPAIIRFLECYLWPKICRKYSRIDISADRHPQGPTGVNTQTN